MVRRSTRLVSPRVEALSQIDRWGAAHASAFVLRNGEPIALHGPPDVELRWASITKIVVGLAGSSRSRKGPRPGRAGRARGLDRAAPVRPCVGPPVPRDGADREARHARIYSNPGFEALAEHVEAAAEMPFAEYLRASVLGPLEMKAELRGSVASDLFGTLDDLVRFARELQSPTLVAPETFAEATSVQFPGLNGVLPGFGRWDPNDWGLGFELRDAKSPHWTGVRNSPRTFGHFGGSGTFLWVDPEAGLACGSSPTASSTSGPSRRGRACPMRCSRRLHESRRRRRGCDGPRERARPRAAGRGRHGVRAVRARPHARLVARRVAHLPAVVSGGQVDRAGSARVRALARARARDRRAAHQAERLDRCRGGPGGARRRVRASRRRVRVARPRRDRPALQHGLRPAARLLAGRRHLARGRGAARVRVLGARGRARRSASTLASRAWTTSRPTSSS